MEYFFIGIFLIFTLLFIAHPLFSSKRYPGTITDTYGEKKLHHLSEKKQNISDNLNDLDFERRMGKLSEEDFEQLRRSCTEDTKEVEKTINTLKTDRSIEELIEREVDKRRKLK